MTLSDLAKYSVTRSVARSLCDSWASCLSYAKAVCQRVSPEYKPLLRTATVTILLCVSQSEVSDGRLAVALLCRLLTCTTVIGLVGLPSRPWYFIIPQETGMGTHITPGFWLINPGSLLVEVRCLGVGLRDTKRRAVSLRQLSFLFIVC